METARKRLEDAQTALYMAQREYDVAVEVNASVQHRNATNRCLDANAVKLFTNVKITARELKHAKEIAVCQHDVRAMDCLVCTSVLV